MFSDQITIIFQLLFAMFLGIVVGADREIVGKEAGIKTYSLVAVGSTMFTILSMNPIFPDNGRIISQIIVGIGFIGAGVGIFKQARVSGVTTAAGIWIFFKNRTSNISKGRGTCNNLCSKGFHDCFAVRLLL